MGGRRAEGRLPGTVHAAQARRRGVERPRSATDPCSRHVGLGADVAACQAEQEACILMPGQLPGPPN